MSVVPRNDVYGFGELPSAWRGLSAVDLGPDALAIAAQQILNSLPAGSGTNPIGTAAYPFPHVPAQAEVPDLQYGGTRYVDWYNAHPVTDVSGLILWTGPDSAQIVDGLDQAHVLVANVLLAHGDTSWSADFHSPTTEELAKPITADTQISQTTVPYKQTVTNTLTPVAPTLVPATPVTLAPPSSAPSTPPSGSGATTAVIHAPTAPGDTMPQPSQLPTTELTAPTPTGTTPTTGGGIGSTLAALPWWVWAGVGGLVLLSSRRRSA